MKGKLGILMVLLLLLSLLAGCVKLPARTEAETTAAEITQATQPAEETQPVVKDAGNLLWRMIDARKGRYASAYTNSVEIDLRVGTPGLSIKVGTGIDMDVQLSSEPFQLYVETVTSAVIADAEMKELTRFYARLEDKTPVVYGYLESMDYWYRAEQDMLPSEILRYYWMTGTPSGTGPDDLTLEPGTQLLDGRETYVMTGTYTGEEMFYELYTALTAMLGNVPLEELDLSGVTVRASYYADAETFLPVQVEMEFLGLEELLTRLINSSQNWYFGSDAEADVEVNTFRAVYSGLQYDPVEVTDVPEEGIRKAVGGSVL